MMGGGILGVWNWYVHSAIFEIDNQQGLNVKKINFESKILMLTFKSLPYLKLLFNMAEIVT